MATGYIMLDSPNRHTAQGVHPRRGGAKLSGTAIVHTTEGNWQAGVAALVRLVQVRSDHGCYHRACDWADIALLYPWEWETWQDSQTNNWAVGIAAACRTSDWGKMPADVEEGFYRNMARMGADFVAYMKEVHRIEVPLKRISGAEARARKPGFCAHGDSGIARSDPGANFDWTRFFRYMKEILEAATQEEDEKMLIIAKVGNRPEHYIGDGVVRRHIPNPQALLDYQHLARIGALKIYRDGQVQTLGSLEALGEEVLPRYFTNQYGSRLDANDQLGFIDLNLNNYAEQTLEALKKLEPPVTPKVEE